MKSMALFEVVVFYVTGRLLAQYLCEIILQSLQRHDVLKHVNIDNASLIAWAPLPLQGLSTSIVIVMF